MKRVILRILMKGSPHAMEIITTESEAQRMISKWRETPKGFAAGYDQGQDRHWSVLHEEIAGMLTIDLVRLEEEQRRQQQALAQQQAYRNQQGQQAPLYPPYHGFGPSAS